MLNLVFVAGVDVLVIALITINASAGAVFHQGSDCKGIAIVGQGHPITETVIR